MSEKRRALGRGLGALIPSTPAGDGNRPVDVFFKDNSATATITIDAPRDASAEADDGFTGNTDAPAAGEQADASNEVAGDGFTGNIEPAPAVTDDLAPVPGARFAELPVRSIRPNPKQPRQVFDEEDMAELVHSIREIGVLQPVVVRAIPADEQALDAQTAPEGSVAPQFELIMGERRWRATQEAGFETIPAIVKDTKDDDLLRDALLENLHRSQLNALEEAAAYQQLLDDFGCTHDQLAGRIGRSRPQISNTLRLLKLPPLVARRVAAGVLSAGHARALLALADAAAMERLAQRIVAEGLSVRNVEEIVALGGDDAPRPARRPRAGNRHPQLDDLAARLSDRFDTRVSIALGQRKGKLTVEFASMDDLNRIIDLLGTPGEDASDS
ncbi:MAG TPA: ParB/RepB/Spo0J family partition protein [Oryzihumus sp.]|nr:ParB/RepB/Spo0J family partition protein [Oryzihumus sp.]